MSRVFVGTVKNGMPYCGIEYEEGTLTREKWKIINHSVSVYIKALAKLEAIDQLEEAENERELYEINQKSLEKLK